MLKDVISIKAKVDEKTGTIKGSWFYAMIELSMWAFASFSAYYYWYQQLSCFALKFSASMMSCILSKPDKFPSQRLNSIISAKAGAPHHIPARLAPCPRDWAQSSIISAKANQTRKLHRIFDWKIGSFTNKTKFEDNVMLNNYKTHRIGCCVNIDLESDIHWQGNSWNDTDSIHLVWF